MDQVFEYSQSVGLLRAIGVLGVLLYISAVAAVQCGVMNGNSLAYSLANVTSSVFVSVSLIAELNLSAASVQSSVIVIGFTGLAVVVIFAGQLGLLARTARGQFYLNRGLFCSLGLRGWGDGFIASRAQLPCSGGDYIFR